MATDVCSPAMNNSNAFEDDLRSKLLEAASAMARESGQTYSSSIDALFKSLGIGKSEVGWLMDEVGRRVVAGRHVMAHRMYGHHFLFDLPWSDPDKIGDFVAHLLSDGFTKQGLPILPGEIVDRLPPTLVRSLGLEKLRDNWGFLNGFDLASGLIAGYFSAQRLRKAACAMRLQSYAPPWRVWSGRNEHSAR